MVKIRKGEWWLLAFNLAYILAFFIYYFSIGNYEFLWYIGVLLFFVVLIGVTLQRTKFDYFILCALSLWGFLHMAGGGIRVGESVLYALRIFTVYSGGPEFYILKFDQVVHFYGFLVCTVIVHHLLAPKLKAPARVEYFVAALASMGLGALNEIVEFAAVVFFPSTGVGGYYNTALDLVFNMLGAFAGILVIKFRKKY